MIFGSRAFDVAGLIMPDGSIRAAPPYLDKPQYLWSEEETRQHVAFQEAMRPVSQSELEQRQLNQAASMRGMTEEELARRYGSGLMNAYRPNETGGEDML